MKKRIVIVEDDYIIQELHRHYVENLGHEVVGAFVSGKEAIDFFKENSADLIMMDIRLEDSMDGIEAMAKIQELSPTPVVYVSGNTEESNFRRAINTNMKGFLSKPVAPDELENIIDSLNDLNDSIIYAERIQKAIFPQLKEINSTFKNSIFINRPKHVISGDFLCLMKRRKNGDIVGGVGDCTGHGVPAALLSVLSHEMLSNNVRKHKELKNIINYLNNNIIRNFSSHNKENKISDSLDLILFRVMPEQQVIQIAGIKRPFIHYDSVTKTHRYISLKGNSLGTPIADVESIPFEEIKFEKDDYFYFFSDGITDQFGGPEGKKLMKKRLIEFLDSVKELPSHRKQIELDIFLRKWQNNTEQTDDMVFLGICPSNAQIKTITKN
jgi:CheY-like chemotaxis protein